MATSSTPLTRSAIEPLATPAAKSPTPGANERKLARPTRTERSGAPSATGRSWQSAPKIVVVSHPSVKRCVTPATCGDGKAPIASSGAIHTRPTAPATR